MAKIIHDNAITYTDCGLTDCTKSDTCKITFLRHSNRSFNPKLKTSVVDTNPSQTNSQWEIEIVCLSYSPF